MDNKPPEEFVPAPKKRAPRKTSTKKTTTRKSSVKEINDAIPESFSSSQEEISNRREEISIACEYSDLVHNVDIEDWSPTKTAKAAAPNGVSRNISRRKTTVLVEDTEDRENLPREEENNRSRRSPRSGCSEGGPTTHCENNQNYGERGDNAYYNHNLNTGETHRNPRSEHPYNSGERNDYFRQNGEPNRGNYGNSRNENYDGERRERMRQNNPLNRNSSNLRDSNFRNPRDNQRIENNRNSNRNFQQNYPNRRRPATTIRIGAFSIGYLRGLEYLSHCSQINGFCNSVIDFEQAPLYLNEVLDKSNNDLADFASSIDLDEASSRAKIIDNCMETALAEKRPIMVKGILESMEGGDGIITYACDSYKIRAKSTFVPRCLIQAIGLRRGQTLTAFVHPPLEQSTCPFAIRINDVLGKSPEEATKFPRFKDLTPYYPTKRIFLEQQETSGNDNVSMRVIDLLSPIGFGQRGLIVAPPRTGKTIFLQGIANAIIHNQPEAKLMVLLIDERPEEVTDFLRQVKGAEVISSTFDESPESHIHAAEIVIESARRWVEAGEHVVILLDSITRLARAYNTEQPSSGKILSGGVEANALQLPKRFFGSARNIEGGGSLTIIATALIETGSRMDDVIFEEFKGTGNMELHLDRSISDKRIFPAINLERSGTRKEELLYHPDELTKIYNLRRAFQGVPSIEAMEMLIARLRKCPTNVEFLMNMNR